MADLWRRRGVKVDAAADHCAEQACRAFLDMAEGGGALYTERVCDGTEVASTWTLLTRRCPRGVLCRNDDTLTPTAVTAVCEWAGRDGGKQKILGGLLPLLANITVTTVATSKTMLLNELRGGTLTLRGVSARTYTIVSNTTAGVISVEADATMDTDIAADDPTNLYWMVEVVNLETDEEKGATRRAVALRVSPRGARRPAIECGLRVKLDRFEQQHYPDLSMVAGIPGRSEIAGRVNNDSNNHEVTLVNAWTGGDQADARPANWAGIATAVSAGGLTLRIVEWQRTVGNATGWIDTFTYGTDLRPQTITLTFLTPTTYTVATDLGIEDIPNAGALGANALDALHPQLMGFTVTAGAVAFQAGDVIVIRVKALPTDGQMVGARLWPDGDGTNAGVSVPIQSSTSRTVTVPTSYDLTSLASVPLQAGATTTAAGPWNTAAGSHGGPVTLTGISVTQDGTAVAVADYTFPDTVNLTAAALKADWDAHAACLLATINADGTVTLGSEGTGGLVSFTYTGGTAIGILMPAAATWTGTDGSLILIEYDQEGQAGYDGIAALAAADVVGALDQNGSIAEIQEDNTGLIVIAAPGWAFDNVVAAGNQLAADINAVFLPEYAITVLTEAAAVAKISDDWGLDDFMWPFWPSWGFVDARDGAGGQEQVSLAGHIMGLQARSWASNGMGKAPSGTSTKLRGVLRLLKANDDVLPDAEQLNLTGIRTITKRGTTDFIIWGDRCPGETEVWVHKRAIKGQVGRELVYPGNFAQYIFETNDTTLWGRLNVALRQLLLPHYEDGWFDSDREFDDAVQIQIDDENNTAATIAAGRVIVDLGLYLPNTAEQIWFRLSELGVEI